jgi:hypothetical protein
MSHFVVNRHACEIATDGASCGNANERPHILADRVPQHVVPCVNPDANPHPSKGADHGSQRPASDSPLPLQSMETTEPRGTEPLPFS